MAKIKMIGWDLGNILCYFDERSGVLTRIVRYFSSHTEVRPVFDGKVGESTYHGLDVGSISIEELLTMLCMEYDIDSKDLPLERFTALMWHHLQPIPIMVDLAQDLQERYRSIAVSNGDVGSRHIAEVLAIHHGVKFEKIFVSGEAGVKKPGLFVNVVEYLKTQGITPDEVLYIDDVEAYVSGARKLGFQAIQFNAVEQPITELLKQLEAIGVEVGVQTIMEFSPRHCLYEKF